MKIIDTVSRSLGLSDDDEKVVELHRKEQPPAEPQQPPQPQPTQPQQPPQSQQMQQPPPPQDPPVPPPQQNFTNNVIDFNSAARDSLMTNNNNSKSSNIKSKITTIRPKSFDEDARTIADCLREDVPVIINLEMTPAEHAQRIIDFALGTTYAIDGDVQQISEKVFVCTPKTVVVFANKEEPKQPDHNDFSWLTRRV